MQNSESNHVEVTGHAAQAVITGTINTLRPRQNGRLFQDDISKCIFWNEITRISLQISLTFVPEVRINNIPALVQIMAWRRPGAKPLSEPMMVSLLTHTWVTRPQWVKLCPIIKSSHYNQFKGHVLINFSFQPIFKRVALTWKCGQMFFFFFFFLWLNVY